MPRTATRNLCRGNKILTAAFEVKDTLKHAGWSMSCVVQQSWTTLSPREPILLEGDMQADQTELTSVVRESKSGTRCFMRRMELSFTNWGDCRRRRYWEDAADMEFTV